MKDFLLRSTAGVMPPEAPRVAETKQAEPGPERDPITAEKLRLMKAMLEDAAAKAYQDRTDAMFYGLYGSRRGKSQAGDFFGNVRFTDEPFQGQRASGMWFDEWPEPPRPEPEHDGPTITLDASEYRVTD